MECFYLNLGGTAGRMTTSDEVPWWPLFVLHYGRCHTCSCDWGSVVGLDLSWSWLLFLTNELVGSSFWHVAEWSWLVVSPEFAVQNLPLGCSCLKVGWGRRRASAYKLLLGDWWQEPSCPCPVLITAGCWLPPDGVMEVAHTALHDPVPGSHTVTSPHSSC